MIAAVSPSSMFYDDTYNTLKYANRAKDIKSSVSMLVFIDLLWKYNNTVLREGELFLLEDYNFLHFCLNFVQLPLLSYSQLFVIWVIDVVDTETVQMTSSGLKAT